MEYERLPKAHQESESPTRYFVRHSSLRPISKKKLREAEERGERIHSTFSSEAKPLGRNTERQEEHFAHDYHSVERVQWVNAKPCMVCVWLGEEQQERTENAHTGKKPGKNLKSHYSTIAPLCGCHHRRYDYRLAPFDQGEARLLVELGAERIHAEWEEEQTRGDSQEGRGR